MVIKVLLLCLVLAVAVTGVDVPPPTNAKLMNLGSVPEGRYGQGILIRPLQSYLRADVSLKSRSTTHHILCLYSIGCVALWDGIYCYGGGAKYAQKPDKTFDDFWLLLFGNRINITDLSNSWYEVNATTRYSAAQATAFMAVADWPDEGMWIHDGTGPSLNGSQLLKEYGLKYDSNFTLWTIFASSDYDVQTRTHLSGAAQMYVWKSS